MWDPILSISATILDVSLEQNIFWSLFQTFSFFFNMHYSQNTYDIMCIIQNIFNYNIKY